MPRKLLFIINPKAGKKLGPALLPLIQKKLDGKLEYEVNIWKNIDEFNQIKERIQNGNYTDAVAVGGDGTVNMVGKSILDSEVTLGIIPAGSGNGLARSLGLSMKTEKALDQIIEAQTFVIDRGEINGRPFFCTAGVGFDAHIGNLFATSVKRGFQSYVKMVWKEFSDYKPQKYILKFNGKEIRKEAFLITAGNAGQYGNNFYIAPGAKMNDGEFFVTVLEPFKLSQTPALLVKVLRRKIDLSPLAYTFSCKELTIEREKEDLIHFDGEPAREEKLVRIICHPHALRVIVGQKFKAG